MEYDEYVTQKLSSVPPTGIKGSIDLDGYGLFGHQVALAKWPLQQGPFGNLC